MRIRWTPHALQDLREIGAFISEDSPDAARRWVDRLQTHAEKVIDAPRSGRVVPEFEREDVRELILKGYRIVYTLSEEEIAFITVFEGHRLFPRGRVKPK
jgi:toxin ParE1/3/4